MKITGLEKVIQLATVIWGLLLLDWKKIKKGQGLALFLERQTKKTQVCLSKIDNSGHSVIKGSKELDLKLSRLPDGVKMNQRRLFCHLHTEGGVLAVTRNLVHLSKECSFPLQAEASCTKL